MNIALTRPVLKSFDQNEKDILFNSLYSEHESTLFKFLKFRYPSQGKDFLQDVVQETFFKVYEKLEYLNENEKFSNWLFTIGINTLRDRLRRERKTQKNCELSENLPFLSEDNLEESDLKSVLGKELLKLPIHFKEVIELHFFNQLKISEIAEKLCQNTNTIKTWLSRAKTLLKKNPELLKIFSSL